MIFYMFKTVPSPFGVPEFFRSDLLLKGALFYAETSFDLFWIFLV